MAPTTCPCGIPVPAYLPVSVYPQCKRRPPSLLLTNGVHPCSLRTKIKVSSKAISWFQVLHQGRKDLVKREAEAGRSSWEVVRMHIPSGLHRSMFIPKQRVYPQTKGSASHLPPQVVDRPGLPVRTRYIRVFPVGGNPLRHVWKKTTIAPKTTRRKRCQQTPDADQSVLPGPTRL